MLLNSAKYLKSKPITVFCGYDLLARAIRDILVEDGFSVEIMTQKSTWAELNTSLLILDDAVFDMTLQNQHLVEPSSAFSSMRVIFIDSTCTPRRVLQALRAGVSGYLYLGDRLEERLKQAVLDVLEEGTYYSPSISAALAEAEHLKDRVLPRINAYHCAVLRGMAHYHSAGQIANSLGRSTQAIYQVQSYLRGLFDVDTNGALLESAVKWGVIQRSSTVSKS